MIKGSIQYVTPGQRHRGDDVGILEERKRVYEAAWERHPERWSGETRNWHPVEEVRLNPPKEHQTENAEKAKAA